jgi:AcrR family transcriptional regulator
METRRRILDAASELFGQKGYRDTTTAEICRAAGANTAGVNYHFSDKASLYAEVLRWSAERAFGGGPDGDDIPPDACAEEKLRVFIEHFLTRTNDRGRFEQFHRLILMEMVNPTGFAGDVLEETRSTFRERAKAFLRTLLGPEATAMDIAHCEMSIMSQCHFAHHGVEMNPARHAPTLSRAEIRNLSEQIARFSLGGICATRKWIESGRGEQKSAQSRGGKA